jgi:Flp pilus assembly protein TadG
MFGRCKRRNPFACGLPLARFLRDTGGAHAVEFALVAPVFILLIAITVELGLSLIIQSNINYATRDASRLILTGQVQTGGGMSVFTNKICGDVNVLISCGNLQYNVQSDTAFGSLTPAQATTSGNMSSTGFSPGGPGSDVLVQVGYPFPCIIPFACNLISANGTVLLISTVAFQNENYGGGGGGGGSGGGGASGSGTGTGNGGGSP